MTRGRRELPARGPCWQLTTCHAGRRPAPVQSPCGRRCCTRSPGADRPRRRRVGPAAITDIYNALLASTSYEYTDTPHTLGRRAEWLHRKQVTGDPIVVADVGGQVVGVASYGAFRDNVKWPGYRFTVELSVHVAESAWGGGIGRSLIEELVGRARAAGMHVMVAAIDASNVRSIRFHERLGFAEVGRLPQVGQKFGRWLDLVLVQRLLD